MLVIEININLISTFNQTLRWFYCLALAVVSVKVTSVKAMMQVFPAELSEVIGVNHS